MSRAQADAFTPAERLRIAVLFGLSGLSLGAARILVLAAHRMTGRSRHLAPEAAA